MRAGRSGASIRQPRQITAMPGADLQRAPNPRSRSLKNLVLAFTVAIAVAGCGGDSDPPRTQPGSLPEVSMARADGTPQTDRPDVDAYVQAQLLRQRIPGASIAVMHAGQIVYAKSYGYADAAAKVPMQPELRLDLGSISKQFVSVAVMMLVEEGRLGLDDRLATYLGDEGPAGWTDITLRQLLSHTAGLPSLPDDAFFNGIGAPGATTEAAMLARFRTYPLLFRPGTGWSYSNVGYDLLGFIVSRVTGHPYREFIQQRVFAPLGINSARFLSAANDRAGAATGYGMVDGGWEPEQLSAGITDYLGTGASGIQMSALDMAKWEAALDAGALVSPASWELMWTPAPSASTPADDYDWGTAYGFGWFLQTLPNGDRVASHSGGMPGFTDEFIHYRDTRWAVVLLTNLGGDLPDPEGIARHVGVLFNTMR